MIFLFLTILLILSPEKCSTSSPSGYNYELLRIYITSANNETSFECNQFKSLEVIDRQLEFYCAGSVIPSNSSSGMTIFITDSNGIIPMPSLDPFNMTWSLELDAVYYDFIFPTGVVNQVQQNVYNYTTNSMPLFIFEFVQLPADECFPESNTTVSTPLTTSSENMKYNYELLRITIQITIFSGLNCSNIETVLGHIFDYFCLGIIPSNDNGNNVLTLYITDPNAVLPMPGLKLIEDAWNITINGFNCFGDIQPKGIFNTIVEDHYICKNWAMPNFMYGNMTLLFESVQMATEILANDCTTIFSTTTQPTTTLYNPTSSMSTFSTSPPSTTGTPNPLNVTTPLTSTGPTTLAPNTTLSSTISTFSTSPSTQQLNYTTSTVITTTYNNSTSSTVQSTETTSPTTTGNLTTTSTISATSSPSTTDFISTTSSTISTTVSTPTTIPFNLTSTSASSTGWKATTAGNSTVSSTTSTTANGNSTTVSSTVITTTAGNTTTVSTTTSPTPSTTTRGNTTVSSSSVTTTMTTPTVGWNTSAVSSSTVSSTLVPSNNTIGNMTVSTTPIPRTNGTNTPGTTSTSTTTTMRKVVTANKPEFKTTVIPTTRTSTITSTTTPTTTSSTTSQPPTTTTDFCSLCPCVCPTTMCTTSGHNDITPDDNATIPRGNSITNTKPYTSTLVVAIIEFVIIAGIIISLIMIWKCPFASRVRRFLSISTNADTSLPASKREVIYHSQSASFTPKDQTVNYIEEGLFQEVKKNPSSPVDSKFEKKSEKENPILPSNQTNNLVQTSQPNIYITHKNEEIQNPSIKLSTGNIDDYPFYSVVNKKPSTLNQGLGPKEMTTVSTNDPSANQGGKNYQQNQTQSSRVPAIPPRRASSPPIQVAIVNELNEAPKPPLRRLKLDQVSPEKQPSPEIIPLNSIEKVSSSDARPVEIIQSVIPQEPIKVDTNILTKEAEAKARKEICERIKADLAPHQKDIELPERSPFKGREEDNPSIFDPINHKGKEEESQIPFTSHSQSKIEESYPVVDAFPEQKAAFSIPEPFEDRRNRLQAAEEALQSASTAEAQAVPILHDNQEETTLRRGEELIELPLFPSVHSALFTTLETQPVSILQENKLREEDTGYQQQSAGAYISNDEIPSSNGNLPALSISDSFIPIYHEIEDNPAIVSHTEGGEFIYFDHYILPADEEEVENEKYAVALSRPNVPVPPPITNIPLPMEETFNEILDRNQTYLSILNEYGGPVESAEIDALISKEASLLLEETLEKIENAYEVPNREEAASLPTFSEKPRSHSKSGSTIYEKIEDHMSFVSPLGDLYVPPTLPTSPPPINSPNISSSWREPGSIASGEYESISAFNPLNLSSSERKEGFLPFFSNWDWDWIRQQPREQLPQEINCISPPIPNSVIPPPPQQSPPNSPSLDFITAGHLFVIGQDIHFTLPSSSPPPHLPRVQYEIVQPVENLPYFYEDDTSSEAQPVQIQPDRGPDEEEISIARPMEIHYPSSASSFQVVDPSFLSPNDTTIEHGISHSIDTPLFEVSPGFEQGEEDRVFAYPAAYSPSSSQNFTYLEIPQSNPFDYQPENYLTADEAIDAPILLPEDELDWMNQFEFY